MDEAEFEKFCCRYEREEDCIKALFQIKWPDGFRCPLCGHRQYYLIRTRRLPLYECRECGHQTSLTAGTIMEGSRLPLRSWFRAFYLHSQSSAVSALRLSEIIGVTYKTAWLLGHKIRHAMSRADERQLLGGLVRITPALYGRAHNSTIYRHPQEHPLLVGATINGEGIPETIKIKQVPSEDIVMRSASHNGVRNFQMKHVKPDATEIISDLGRSIRLRSNPLMRLGKMAATWLNATFKGIGPKHLQAYLDQYCYLTNQAILCTPSVSQCISLGTRFARITYRELVSRPSRIPVVKDYFQVLKTNKRKRAG
ncbi:transposase [Cohnella sp. CFH 77786]|uniref:transposase n=1 Tax=Cohnella sp. CFH 77786 TaxID=2662265 RepID=UPI001C60BFF0|nr:transposase [Cohnella sp. CFH 77786]